MLWPHKRFTLDLELGNPVVQSSIPDCGASVEDPSGYNSSVIDLKLPVATRPELRHPFDVPVVVNHSTDAYGVQETLSLDGTVHFALVGLTIPSLN